MRTSRAGSVPLHSVFSLSLEQLFIIPSEKKKKIPSCGQGAAIKPKHLCVTQTQPRHYVQQHRLHHCIPAAWLQVRLDGKTQDPARFALSLNGLHLLLLMLVSLPLKPTQTTEVVLVIVLRVLSLRQSVMLLQSSPWWGLHGSFLSQCCTWDRQKAVAAPFCTGAGKTIYPFSFLRDY